MPYNTPGGAFDVTVTMVYKWLSLVISGYRWLSVVVP